MSKEKSTKANGPDARPQGLLWARFRTGCTRGQIIRYALYVLFATLFCAAAVFLNRPVQGAVPTSASLLQYAPVEVLNVLEDNASADTWTEGRRVGSQKLQVKILSGTLKGRIMEVNNYLDAYSGVDARKGSRLIVLLSKDDNGDPRISNIYSFDRRAVVGGFVLLFAGALVIIGGKKGLKALLGLVFTLVCLWFILIPIIVRGANPILTTVGIVVLTAAVSLLLLDGPTKKTLCAVLGCAAGVIAAGVSAAVVGYLAGLNGFNMSEAEGLVLVASDEGLRISGLLVCSVLIASMGAVMDVAMSIASTSNELYILNPELTARQLFQSGMNVGRDAMGTMANTLILAFVGSGLNMLILFRVYNYPMLQLMNSDLMVLEILQGIAGSIGIIFTVPLVAAVSAYMLRGGGKKAATKAVRS
ncbi:YibE/F-like protein [uncultured Eubacteriales bacterium]|uniref:YibE/F-like protein n=1 Tax=uncultured Eubacteriales bacterium TaxID=172733 RepID=A0A212KJJ0_9FIRM|nr:YibE/F-like protein [uncultured Eubacteriales bacterium]